jgi:hypothetical protein
VISIIIPNYNGEHFLPCCLDSVFSQDYFPYEVILVDNASSDHSVALVRECYPLVKIVQNQMNRGYAGGCNDGCALATGDYYLFLNTDTTLPGDFLTVMHNCAQERPEYGMYAPKILYPDGSLQAAGCDASFSGSARERGRGLRNSRYDVPSEVFSPYGAAALFSKELIQQTRGFDEDFFLFVEETDLALRARLAGFRCWYEPKAMVIHHHGGTAGRSSDIALYYLHRNTLWYVIKSYPITLFFISFPLIVGRNILSVLYYALQGRGKIIIRSKFDAIMGVKKMMRKRKNVFRTKEKIRYHFSLFIVLKK